MKTIYIALLTVVSFTIGYVTQSVTAQTVYCDRELWIFLFNNNLESLADCINAPDMSQDIKLYQLETKINITDAKVNEMQRK